MNRALRIISYADPPWDPKCGFDFLCISNLEGPVSFLGRLTVLIPLTKESVWRSAHETDGGLERRQENVHSHRGAPRRPSFIHEQHLWQPLANRSGFLHPKGTRRNSEFRELTRCSLIFETCGPAIISRQTATLSNGNLISSHQ
jgi:hypothetical protein